MNRKMVLLPMVVLLAVLMVGSNLGTTVKAYETNDENNRPSQYNPLSVYFGCTRSSPVWLVVDNPSVSSPGDTWRSGNVIHIRAVIVTAYYEIRDQCGNSVPGLATFTIYSDVNVKTCKASTWIGIIMDNDYGWWQGEMNVQAKWINGQLSIHAGTCKLYGQGGCWGWTIKVTLNFSSDDFGMNGKMWNPIYEQWCPMLSPQIQ